MVDIVYILINTSRWRNNELRYSLRSVETNLQEEIGNVFIVGFLPKFIKENVIHIPAEDPFQNKLKNACHKLFIACKDKRLGEKFILMNDDFFIMKPQSYKLFNKGTLIVSENGHSTHKGYYFKAIQNTRNLLQERGIGNPVDYEVHCPMLFEKTKLLRVLTDLRPKTPGYLFRSIYGNLYCETGQRIKDIKIFNKTIHEQRRCFQSDIISTDDQVATNGIFQKFIKVCFPKRSIYEKDNCGFWRATNKFNYEKFRYNSGDIVRGAVPMHILKANGAVFVDRYI